MPYKLRLKVQRGCLGACCLRGLQPRLVLQIGFDFCDCPTLHRFVEFHCHCVRLCAVFLCENDIAGNENALLAFDPDQLITGHAFIFKRDQHIALRVDISGGIVNRNCVGFQKRLLLG